MRGGNTGKVIIVVLMPTVLSGCPLVVSTTPPPATTAKMVGLELFASGLTSPVGMAFPNDGTGRVFVVDQIGLVRVVDGAGHLLPTALLDLRNRMVALNPFYDEKGLLGLALHPEFAANGRLFVYYSAPRAAGVGEEFAFQTNLSEFRISSSDPNLANSASERIVLTVPQPAGNHNGGQLEFGPDGFLYVGVGDGGGANDVGLGHTPELGNAQDKSTLLGKILRIDVDQGDPYAVPLDNPFVDDAGARDEIWALGLRNPWRFSFDAAGDRRLFVGDVGQNLFEEVSLVQRGGNYGWNIREGAHCFDPSNSAVAPPSCASRGADSEPLFDPIIEYPHADEEGRRLGTAVIGGFVYRGSAIPDLFGHYVFADFSTSGVSPDGRLFVATESSDGIWTFSELGVATSPSRRIGRFVLGFGQDAAGELFILSSGLAGPSGTEGQVHRIVPVEAERGVAEGAP